jgi:UDP:flavonoid glycosyltransferase YjiC (YdhE family)
VGVGLALYLGFPWCFVYPSFYFGDPFSVSWAADWYGEGTRLFLQHCFLPVSQRADLVLHATDHEFDAPAVPLPPNHQHVGFLLWEPPSDLPEFLTREGDPWALITTSSVPQPDEFTMARAALEALANQPVRTLLTLPNRDPAPLGTLPDNATIVPFVPHIPVIQRSAIVVSHAGHGIVSKSLYYGVPMVLLPWDRDQPGVASRAEKLGVATVVPRQVVSPETVRQAVEAVLNESDYGDMAARVAARLQATDAVERACAALEGLMLS